MFDIGWTEMLVIAIVMIVVVGPKDLPRMLRTFGRTTSRLRVMAGDFRKQFDEALKEAELDDVKDIVNDARKLDPTADIKKAFNPMRKVAEDVRAGLDAAMKPGTAPASASSEALPAEPAKAGATAMPEGMARPADMSKVNAAQLKQMDGQAKALAERAAAAEQAEAAGTAAKSPRKAAKPSGKPAAAPKTPAKRPAVTKAPRAKAAGSATGPAPAKAAPKQKTGGKAK